MNRKLFVALAALVCCVLFWEMRGLPFFSEDYTQLLEKSRLASVWEALSPALEPLRPLQHLPWFVMSRFAEPDPAWLRALACLLHFGSSLLVVRLARKLGATESVACAAAFLFLLFPCAKGLVWGAGISTPFRVFFLLGALVCFAERRSVGLIACFLFALAAHESAIVLPVLLALYAWTQNERARLREPAFLACAGIAIALALYLAFLRPQRHHALKSLDALPANFVKAALALAPEPLRVFCVERFRAHADAFALIAAGLLLLVWLAPFAWALLRGGPTLRFLVLAIAADFVLPVIGAGFSQRYAYLAGAFAAIGLLLWHGSKLSWRRSPIVAAIFLAWTIDSAQDYREYRAAGELERRVLTELRAERARAGPDTVIAVVDLPDMAGSEQDLPLFNWGTEECLKRAAIPGPWVLWRTHSYRTGTDFVEISPAALAAARTRGELLLIFDPRALDDSRRAPFAR